MPRTLRARITSTGSYLPKRVLSNNDLEKMVDTSDEWISSRTGMKERRIAAKDESSSDMAIKSAKKALHNGKIDPEEIDLVLVATVTPDYVLPSTAALVQAKIGAINAGAVDLQAACVGYLYGLSIAKAYIESGIYRNVLVVATDKMSSILDYEDRKTCVLFGDGAATTLVSAQGPGYAIDSICLGADGELSDLIIIPAGGSRCPT
ncbi:MAG: beta-ketoacyl-ACP synthase 3, partial [Waddliaceae bacterium]